MEVLLLVVKCFPITSFIIISSQCSKQGNQLNISSIEASEIDSIEIKKIRKKEEKEAAAVVVAKNQDEKRLTNEPILFRTPTEAETSVKNELMVRDEGGKGSESEVEGGDVKKEKVEPDKEIQLDDTNEHIVFVLENQNACKDSEKLKEFCAHLKILNDQIGCFQWAMKKRFGFDETSWKHMSKRIALLKAEGFKVRVNTRKARENKRECEALETKLDAIINRRKEGKKKKFKKAKE